MVVVLCEHPELKGVNIFLIVGSPLRHLRSKWTDIQPGSLKFIFQESAKEIMKAIFPTGVSENQRIACIQPTNKVQQIRLLKNLCKLSSRDSFIRYSFSCSE